MTACPQIRHLKVAPMAPEQIAQALPLAQALRSDMTVAEWRRFCEGLMNDPSPNRGIECAADEHGYLLGFFAYQAQPDLTHGRVLSIDPFIAIDLYGRDYSAQRMLVRIESLAKSLNCASTHVALGGIAGKIPKETGARVEKFLEMGYRADAMRLCKELV
jgi:hypothetical protein